MTQYTAGDTVKATSGLQLPFPGAERGGSSGMTEPVWPTSLGGTTADGTTWKAIAPWSAADVLERLRSSTPPSIVALNGHYNQFQLEAAAGTLGDTGQAAPRTSPPGSSSRWAATAA